MNSKEAQQIKAWFYNQLPREEAQDVEEKIRQNPDFAKEVRDHLKTEISLQQAGDAELKEMLLSQPLDGKIINFSGHTRLPWLWISSSAAAVILILLTVFWPGQTQKSIAWQELYAQHFPSVEAPNIVRSQAEFSESYQAGIREYQAANYPSAINYWKTSLLDSIDPEVQLFIGLSYQQTGKLDSAEYYLQQVPATSGIRPKASWYLAGICLLKEDINCFRDRLSRIAGSNGHYQQMLARQLLEEL